MGDVVEYVVHGCRLKTRILEGREEETKRKEKCPKTVERVGVGLLMRRRGVRSRNECVRPSIVYRRPHVDLA